MKKRPATVCKYLLGRARGADRDEAYEAFGIRESPYLEGVHALWGE